MYRSRAQQLILTLTVMTMQYTQHVRDAPTTMWEEDFDDKDVLKRFFQANGLGRWEMNDVTRNDITVKASPEYISEFCARETRQTNLTLGKFAEKEMQYAADLFEAAGQAREGHYREGAKAPPSPASISAPSYSDED